MQTFKDKTGQDWEIIFTVWMRKLVSKRHQVDIAMLLEEETARQLKEKPELLVETLWTCIESQAIDRGVTAEQFFTDLIDQERLDEICDLLFSESVEYAPEKKRPRLQKVLDLWRKTDKKMQQTSMKHIDNTDFDALYEEIAEEIESLVQKKSRRGSLNLPLSRASPPTTEASES